jgi:hypothetical protein
LLNAFASLDLWFAALLLWTAPAATALSYALFVSFSAASAFARSPEASASRNRRDNVFSLERSESRRTRRRSFWRLRLIWDLMLAIGARF